MNAHIEFGESEIVMEIHGSYGSYNGHAGIANMPSVTVGILQTGYFCI
jgi:hypothetical protein